MDKIDIRDLILRTLKENEAGLVDQSNYVKAVKSDYYLQVAESVVENLPIYVVMQQRELLLAYESFSAKKAIGYKDERVSKQLVEDFLANNCG